MKRVILISVFVLGFSQVLFAQTHSVSAQHQNPSVKYEQADGMHLVFINLNDLGLRFQTVLANDRGGPTDRESVQSMALRHGAIVAVNTDYFGNCGQQAEDCKLHGAEGAITINGTTVRDSSCRTSMAISADNQVSFERIHVPASRFNVAGGGPLFLRGGVAVWTRGGTAACAGCDARDVINGECFPGSSYWDRGTVQSAVALSRDGSIVIFAVTDESVKPAEMARRLAVRGGYTAIKLDGGRSSALFYNGKALKAGRPVAEALLVLPRKPQLNISAIQAKTGDSITITGTGFTPNGSALSHLRKPDGSEFNLLTITTDGRGTYAHTIITTTSFSPGTYESWWVDQATGIQSNPVQFQLPELPEPPVIQIAQDPRVLGAVLKRPETTRAPERIRLSAGTSGQRLLHKVQPIYPEAAKRARIEGNVTLEILIDKQGNVADLQLKQSDNAVFDKPTRDAVARWRYRPYMFNGQAVEVQTEAIVTFILNTSEPPQLAETRPSDRSSTQPSPTPTSAQQVQENESILTVNKLLAQATQLSQAGNHEAAIQAIMQATQLMPDRDLLWSRLGDLELQAGKTSTDRTKASKFYQDAIVHFQKAIEINPAQGRYRESLREAHARSGENTPARAENEPGIAQRENPWSVQQTSAQAEDTAGVLLSRAKQEYAYAEAHQQSDTFVAGQKAYVRAAYLIEEMLKKYPAFSDNDEALLLLGRSKRHLNSSVPEAQAYKQQHRADYETRELHGEVYTGREFKELIRQYPSSRFRDDAAFELSVSKIVGPWECLADTTCHLKRELDRFEEFLRGYPNSPKAKDVVGLINRAGFGDSLENIRTDIAGGSGSMAVGFRNELDRYYSLSRTTPLATFAEAASAIAKGYEAIKQWEIAAQIYRDLMQKLPRSSSAPVWRQRLNEVTRAKAGSAHYSSRQAIADLHSNNSLKMLSAARFLASRQDRSYLLDVERWIGQSRQLADLHEDNSLCELLRWTFQLDAQFVYKKIADWNGGGMCVWTLTDQALPRRVLGLADSGHAITATAAREALRRLPEPEVINNLLHPNRAVRGGAIFVVMQKKYSSAVPRLWQIIGEDPELNEEAAGALAEIDLPSEICYRVLWLLRARTAQPNMNKSIADWFPIVRLQKLVGFSPPLDAQNQPLAKQRILNWWRTSRIRILDQVVGMPVEIRQELERL